MDKKEIEEYKKKQEIKEKITHIITLIKGIFLLPWGLVGILGLFFEMGYIIFTTYENPTLKSFLLIMFKEGCLLSLCLDIIMIILGCFGIKLIRSVWLNIK